MRLQRFRSEKLHGFLDFDVSFDERLTFLTGINGSGKTTILNAIVALITPDLALLQAIEFNNICLDLLDDNGEKAQIRATRSEEQVELSVNKTASKFKYNVYIAESAPAYRQQEAEQEHFRELVASSSAHPVMRFIASLPTPMFLGLDRRAKLQNDHVRNALLRQRTMSGPRNVFGGSMRASLADAEGMAEAAYRDARINSGRIGELLQRDMLLSLLTFTKDDYSGEISYPTEQERKDLRRVRDDLKIFPDIFNLPKAEVDQRVSKYIELLEKTVSAIPRDASATKDFRTNAPAPSYFNELITWSVNRSQLKKIKVISQTVSSYNERREEALQPFERYRGLVNDFLDDSGKEVVPDFRSGIAVRIEGVEGLKPLSSLSSGEAQIFVILTNLAFNVAAQKANVFIIDEPELSLHVRWQEMFVDSMLTANSNIQFLMATHSPSIILDRLTDCVDVTRHVSTEALMSEAGSEPVEPPAKQERRKKPAKTKSAATKV